VHQAVSKKRPKSPKLDIPFKAAFEIYFSCRPLYGVPHGILQVFIIILYKNVFQNPELFPTQVSLYPEKSTLTVEIVWKNYDELSCTCLCNEGAIKQFFLGELRMHKRFFFCCFHSKFPVFSRF
jgi:hypothetical protein